MIAAGQKCNMTIQDVPVPRGIFIHGTMGPGWSPTTWGNSIFLSPTSHGCVRMCNSDNIDLHKIMPDPRGNKIIIGTEPEN